jgi:hypothetical protein
VRPWPPLVGVGAELKDNQRDGHQRAAANNIYPKRVGHRGPPLQGSEVPGLSIQASEVRGRPLEGWGKFLRADDVFFQILERGGATLRPLSHFAQVRFGVKTGANEFFYFPDEQAKLKEQSGKSSRRDSLRTLSEIASVRRGLTTGANEFFYLPQNGAASSAPTPNSQRPSPNIEPEFLSPVIFSLKEIPGIMLDRAHTKRLFFNCTLKRDELEGTGALDYIRRGERAGYHLRPTCASRDPWYALAREMKPAPLIFPSKVGERWVVALNRAGVFEDKKLYGVFPADGVSRSVLAALLNSTWARYYAEITCRQMTGAQAIADIDVAVAEQIMIPDPRQLSSELKRSLRATLKVLLRRPIGSVFEEVKREDRRALDELALEAMGFRRSSSRRLVMNDLYHAITQLVESRISRVGYTARSRSDRYLKKNTGTSVNVASICAVDNSLPQT